MVVLFRVTVNANAAKWKSMCGVSSFLCRIFHVGSNSGEGKVAEMDDLQLIHVILK